MRLVESILTKNPCYTAGIPVLCKLLFDGLMDFSGEGAWLPVMSKDGIPAYIKARTT